MKTVGIIGGLGPKTTAEFYSEVSFQCQNFNKINRPSIIIYSVPLPYDIEEDAIAKGIGEERCLPFLIDAAQSLEKAGADFLVMPCNSLHIFIKNIRESVKIPVLSIVEETTNFLTSKNILEVGVLSTEITLKNKIYGEHLFINNVQQILPDDYQQAKIGKIIHNLVLNRYGNEDRAEFLKIIDSLAEKGAKNIILACTDLQILIPQHKAVNIYDTMKILADSTVKNILE